MAGDARALSIAELVQRYLAEQGPLTVIDQYELPPGINWDADHYRGDAYPDLCLGVRRGRGRGRSRHLRGAGGEALARRRRSGAR